MKIFVSKHDSGDSIGVSAPGFEQELSVPSSLFRELYSEFSDWSDTDALQFEEGYSVLTFISDEYWEKIQCYAT
jgi:hypothetical protein